MLKKFLIPRRLRFIACTGWPAGFDGAEFSRSACTHQAKALIKYPREKETEIPLGIKPCESLLLLQMVLVRAIGWIL